MILGFTGTREELTEKQIRSLTKLLKKMNSKYDFCEFHHGDCIGADAKSHEIIIKNKIFQKIIIHPPTNSKLRAYTYIEFPSDRDSLEVHILGEKEYLDRNKDIVDSCEILLVCPCQKEEILRSGTWQTYRTARKLNKKIILIYPDGTIEIWPDKKLIKKIKEKFSGKKEKNGNTT